MLNQGPTRKIGWDSQTQAGNRQPSWLIVLVLHLDHVNLDRDLAVPEECRISGVSTLGIAAPLKVVHPNPVRERRPHSHLEVIHQRNVSNQRRILIKPSTQQERRLRDQSAVVEVTPPVHEQLVEHLS